MLCASYDQLKVGATYMNKSNKSVIHMDSSGKFLKQGKGKKKLLNTAIVIPPAAPGHVSPHTVCHNTDDGGLAYGDTM